MNEPNAEKLTLESIIKSHIERVLWMSRYNQSQAARILGLPLSSLRSKMKKFGIETREKRKDRSTPQPPGDISPSRSDIPPLNLFN